MEFVLVPAGSFTMGSPLEENFESPPHTVEISSPFYLGRTEVTQEQWESVMGSNPSLFRGPHRPVERVSWDDARAFLVRLEERNPGLHFNLPTEAQWEYACRGGSESMYLGGDGPEGLDDYAWYIENSGEESHPVGEKSPNAFGLHDMIGNVWEWCSDYWGPYTEGRVRDPRGPTEGTDRVFRGRGWGGHADWMRPAHRDGRPPEFRYESVGVRCLAEVR